MVGKLKMSVNTTRLLYVLLTVILLSENGWSFLNQDQICSLEGGRCVPYSECDDRASHHCLFECNEEGVVCCKDKGYICVQERGGACVTGPDPESTCRKNRHLVLHRNYTCDHTSFCCAVPDAFTRSDFLNHCRNVQSSQRSGFALPKRFEIGQVPRVMKREGRHRSVGGSDGHDESFVHRHVTMSKDPLAESISNLQSKLSRVGKQRGSKDAQVKKLESAVRRMQYKLGQRIVPNAPINIAEGRPWRAHGYQDKDWPFVPL